MAPSEGERAPDFEALLCDGETFRPANLDDVLSAAGGVVVFSAFAHSAIAENWWGRYDRAGWDEFGVPVVGVFPDGPYSVNAFARGIDSPFEFFADVNDAAAGAFDLLSERDGMGGTRTARRAAFVLEGDRSVAYAWIADDWISPSPRTEIEEAISDLG